MTLTVFQPNCTFPSTSVGFVDDPPLRSTLDIVWSSLATIIACTYTSLHLLVIADHNTTSTKSGWWQDTKRGLRNLGIELVIAFVGVLAPEYPLILAIIGFHWGRTWSWDPNEDISFWRGKSLYDSQGWTRMHFRYARFGGFRLCLRKPPGIDANVEDQISDEVMLDETTLSMAIQERLVAAQPTITEREINDLSKAGPLAKTLAMWQIFWFGVQVVIRLARKLPLSQLEIGTAAFIVISLPTWIFSFNQPKQVECGTRLYLNPERNLSCTYDETGHTVSASKIVRITDLDGSDSASAGETYRRINGLRDCQTRRMASFWKEVLVQLTQEMIEDQKDRFNFEIITPLVALASLVAVLFGAVHIAAWNSQFPTQIDVWLWRTASLLTTTILLSNIFTMAVSYVIGKERWDVWPKVSMLAVSMYVIARLVLIVEMVRCLAYLPPRAYVSTWASSLPHLG